MVKVIYKDKAFCSGQTMKIASIEPLIIWYNVKDIPKASNIRGGRCL